MKKQVGRLTKRVGAVLLSVAVIMSSTASNLVSYAAQQQDVTAVVEEAAKEDSSIQVEQSQVNQTEEKTTLDQVQEISQIQEQITKEDTSEGIKETENTSEAMTDTKTATEAGITESELSVKDTADNVVEKEVEIATEETTKVETVETEGASEVKTEAETETVSETEEMTEQISLMSLALVSDENATNADGTGYFVDCGYGRLTTGQTSETFVEKSEAHTYINAVADAEYTEESGWGYVADSIDGTKGYVDGIGLYATGYYGDKKTKDVTYYVTLDEGDYTFTSGHYEWWNTSARKTDVIVSYEGKTENYEKVMGTASFTGTKGQSTTVTGEFSVDADDTLVTLTFAMNDSSVEAGTVAYFEILPVEEPEQPEQKPEEQGGLIAHYTFEDVDGSLSDNTQIKDISGKENHATLYGTGASVQNGELSLPGGANNSSAAYVQLPTGMFDAQETLTISVWLQNKTGAGNYCAMSFGTEKNSNGYPTNYWLLNPCNPSGYFKSVLTDGIDAGGPWNSETVTSTTATNAEWGMYTTVITPESIKGYYNGVEVCTDTKEIAIADFGENLLAYIGKSSYSDQFYAGKVKDVRVYTEALSAEEIMTLYEEETKQDEQDQPQEGGLLAQYTFDGLSGSVTNGTQVKDVSGNDNHATIYGDGASVTKGALRLPGGANGSSAAYVQLPTGMFDAQEILTISVWMQNMTGAGNYAGMFFGTDKNSSGNPTNYWLLNPCNPSGYFKTVVTNGSNPSGPWSTETAVSTTTTSNGWGLYTTVITPNSITGYYNGKQVSSASKDIAIADFGENLLAFIGKSSYPDKFYAGQVKDVRVYTTALSANEIADMYAAEFPSLPTSDIKATKIETDLPTDEVISIEAGEDLDATAKITLNDGSVVNGYISWDKDIASLEPGEYTVNGVVDYYPYPLIEERADPQIYQDTENNCYYFTSSWPAYGSMSSGYNKIVIRKADTIAELATAEDITIWNAHTSGEQMYHVWAPELHKIGDDWYIYYAASTASNGWGIRCFVLTCDGDKDITKAENWTELGHFLDENGNELTNMCLDMTFFEANGKSFVIWADKNLSTNISDIKMGPIDPAKPYQLSGSAITLSTPEYEWELVREKVNEGPAVFIRDGKVYVTYSASATGVEYCVGLLWASLSENLMDVDNWNKCTSPVLSTADTQGEYGPGHNSFTVDENGNLLMIYHARDEECYQDKCGYANVDSLYDPCRNALVKYVRFSDDGFPIFSSSATKELGDMRNISVTINVGNITATDKVQADADAITLYNLNDVRGNMTLPSVGAVYGNKITWTSSDEEVISKTGMVNRPSAEKKVTLTATVTSIKDTSVKVTKDFEATVVKKAEVADFEAYLFAYFTGEGSANGEQIYFATSEDGLHWEALNEGEPVITSTLGEKGLRDPFIIRSPEGDKFYLIATDLRIYDGNGWSAAQNSGSRSIMIWESTDLVNWSEQRMVEVATEGAGCTWAPEAFYNDATGEYMVFWSSKIPSTYNVENNDYTHRVYYATTRDFYTFSEPKVWIELHNPSDNAISVIDATVVKVGDTYYRFTKNEATEAHRTGCSSSGKYTILETSKSLLGTWTEIESNINTISGVEGATCFKFNGEDKWCLLLDNHGGVGYYPLVTDDLSSGEFTKLSSSEYSFPSKMRHGTVISLTQEEYYKLYPPTTVERVDDADESLTYEGNFTQSTDAGSDYYRRTLSTGVAEDWTEIDHTSTATESGTLNKFYYQTASGGAWSYNSDNAWAGTAGEYYEVTFYGTDIDLYGYCNPSNGSGTVYIDGEKAGTLDCNSSSYETKVVFSATGLTSGEHTVKVVVDKDGGYVSAAGAKVCDKKDVETSVSGSFTGTGFTVIGTGSDGSFAIYVDGAYVETQTDAVVVKNLEDKKKHTYKIVVKEGTLCVDAIEYRMAYNGEEPVDYELEDAIYQLKQLVSKYALTEEEKESYSPASLEKYEEAYKYAKKVSEGWGEQTLERIQSYTSKLEKKYAGLQAKGTPVTYTSFTGTNGEPWYDTDGTEIQAHGGQILPVTQNDGSVIYYWYGEDKTDGYRTVDGGVRVYSSTDLYNWKSEGIAMRNLTDAYDFEEDYFKELYAGYTDAQKEAVLLGINDTTSVIERPKVIYNEKNDKYVMWFHADGPTETSTANYAAASAGVAVSDSPTGPFRYIDRYRLHYVNGAYDSDKGMARDMNLFVDDDGKAYIIYSSEQNQTMFISLLDEDYTALAVDADEAAKIYDETGEMSGFNRIACYIGMAREAPALFKYDGAYYLMTSGCTGWGANPASYAICRGDSPLDTWTDMGNPCVSDTSICKYGANLTFGSQSTSVLAVNPEKGEYLYMGDRWNNSSPAGNSLIDPKYIWLPIQFTTNGEMIIYPKNDWTLDDLGIIQYAVEPAEELEGHIGVDGLDSLPTSMNFIFEEETVTSRVNWEVVRGDINYAGSLVTIKGTLLDFKEGKTSIEREMLVVSDDLLYLIDCGMTADSGYTSKLYQLAAEKSELCNDTPDAAYDEAKGWGYDSNSIAGTKGYEASCGSLKELGYYGDNSKNITYYVTLDAGEYDLVSGHYEWWNTSRRHTDVIVSYEHADDTVYQQLIGTSTFGGSKGEEGQVYGTFAVEEDNTLVAITFAKASSSIEAGTVAFFGIAKHYVAPEKEDKPSTGTTTGSGSGSNQSSSNTSSSNNTSSGSQPSTSSQSKKADTTVTEQKVSLAVIPQVDIPVVEKPITKPSATTSKEVAKAEIIGEEVVEETTIVETEVSEEDVTIQEQEAPLADKVEETPAKEDGQLTQDSVQQDAQLTTQTPAKQNNSVFVFALVAVGCLAVVAAGATLILRKKKQIEE